MLATRVFTSGNSQAVRIPKEYQLDETELYIKRIGSTIILYPKTNRWSNLERSFTEFSDDFMQDGRNQPGIQIREDF